MNELELQNLQNSFEMLNFLGKYYVENQLISMGSSLNMWAEMWSLLMIGERSDGKMIQIQKQHQIREDSREGMDYWERLAYNL